MRGFSLTQPWATLVAIGAKTIETRSWQTSYRGPLAIHASKGFPRDCQQLCREQPFVKVLIAAGFDNTNQLPTGAIIAVALLDDVKPTAYFVPGSGYPANINSQEKAFGDYGPDRFGWVLRDVKALPQPIACKGALGLWHLPPAIWDALRGVAV